MLLAETFYDYLLTMDRYIFQLIINFGVMKACQENQSLRRNFIPIPDQS